jgi:hypothetical protein
MMLSLLQVLSLANDSRWTPPHEPEHSHIQRSVLFIIAVRVFAHYLDITGSCIRENESCLDSNSSAAPAKLHLFNFLSWVHDRRRGIDMEEKYRNGSKLSNGLIHNALKLLAKLERRFVSNVCNSLIRLSHCYSLIQWLFRFFLVIFWLFHCLWHDNINLPNRTSPFLSRVFINYHYLRACVFCFAGILIILFDILVQEIDPKLLVCAQQANGCTHQ